MHTICLVAVDNVPLTPGLGATTQLSHKLEDKMISEEIIKIYNKLRVDAQYRKVIILM